MSIAVPRSLVSDRLMLDITYKNDDNFLYMQQVSSFNSYPEMLENVNIIKPNFLKTNITNI